MPLEQVQPGVSGQDLGSAVRELQNIKRVVVAGANANTNIAIAGIKATDTLFSVIEHAGPGEAGGVPAVVDRTAQAAITSAGNIQVTVATNTSADRRLVVTYFSKPADLTD